MRSRWLCGLLLCAGLALADPAFTPVEIARHVYDGGWEHFVGGGRRGVRLQR